MSDLNPTKLKEDVSNLRFRWQNATKQYVVEQLETQASKWAVREFKWRLVNSDDGEQGLQQMADKNVTMLLREWQWDFEAVWNFYYD